MRYQNVSLEKNFLANILFEPSRLLNYLLIKKYCLFFQINFYLYLYKYLNVMEIGELPSSIEIGVGRSIETKVGEPAFSRQGLNPVARQTPSAAGDRHGPRTEGIVLPSGNYWQQPRGQPPIFSILQATPREPEASER